MAATSAEISRDLVVAWIQAWKQAVPEPREIADAFKYMHGVVVEAQRAESSRS